MPAGGQLKVAHILMGPMEVEHVALQDWPAIIGRNSAPEGLNATRGREWPHIHER